MIAGGDVYLQVWFDPLVSSLQLHLFSTVNDTVQTVAVLKPSDIIKPSGPSPKLTRPLTPKKLFSFFGNDECFWWQGFKRSYSTATLVLPPKTDWIATGTGDATFNKLFHLSRIQFQVRALRSRPLLLCTRFIQLKLSKNRFRNFGKAIIWSFRSIPLSIPRWMGYPGDLLFSDSPRNYRWLSIMTILNFMQLYGSPFL